MNKQPYACSFALSQNANGRIQLFPFGRFYPADQRPAGKNGWVVDDSNGFALADEVNQLAIQLMIDYEHQTLFIAQNGKGNPAAGWIARAEYLSGEGIFAEVQWTEKATQEIKDRTYRYISPLFLADERTGKVTKILNAALTNRPALHNLAEAFAASQFALSPTHQPEGTPMKALLIKLFALSETATDQDITDKLTALVAAKGDSQVALSEVYAHLKSNSEQIVSLSAQVASASHTPDPAKYVALSDLQAVQTELNQFKQQVNQEKRDALIQVALSDGRLLPAQKAWAEQLGAQNLNALSDYLATVSPNPALNGTQSGGQDPNTQNAVALSAAELAAAKALGMSEAEFIQTHKEQK